MNYLAHIFLSGNNAEVQLGNFIADHVNGNHFDRFSENIIRGIKLHRKIDTFTDNHPIFDKSRDYLQPFFHKYAGVVIDMYYDHFLAKHWSQFSNEKIESFVFNAYRNLISHYYLLPKELKRLLPFMFFSNWLVNYRNLNDLQTRFEGMARRINHQVRLENAVAKLKENYTTLENDFFIFFPALIEFTESNLIQP